MRPSFAPLLALGLTAAAPPATAQPDPKPTPAEQKTIDLVTKTGGKAEIDPKLPAEARVAAAFETATDATLLNLKKAPQVGSLSVADAAKCTDRGFAALKDLPHLRKLVVGKSRMSGPVTGALGQCKQLRTLYLGDAGLSDQELIGLKKLTLLESLDISGNPQITDKGMVHLKALERLQALYLANTSITDKAFAELKSLDGLCALNVVGTKVTGDAADRFADDMPNLRTVRR
jgi:hypothetical protein